MKQTLLFSLFLIFQNGFSQTLLKGKVISDASNLNKIDVINLSNKKNIQTQNDGSFVILAEPNDVLMIYGREFEIVKVVLTEKDFSNPIFEIQLQPKINKLEEVVVKNYPHINAVSLGIISKNVKTYTPAERGRYSRPKNILDRIKIMVTGKNPARDAVIKVERNIKYLSKLKLMFDEGFYTAMLKIPLEYVNGFQVFVLDDPKIIQSLKAKKKV